MTIYGWDASNWDDPPTQRDGLDVYTHKAGEGHHFYRDQEYGPSLSNARNLGIPILGAYFVNHGGSVDDQVDWFIQILDQDTPWWRTHPCFILQIDAEKFDYMDRAPTKAEIQAFGDRLVNVHHVKPTVIGAYAPQWLYGNTLSGLTYWLWASNYGSNPAGPYRSVYPGDGSLRWAPYSGQTPLLLQYGSNTTIAGQTTSDANAYRGTVSELVARLTGGETEMYPVWVHGQDDSIWLSFGATRQKCSKTDQTNINYWYRQAKRPEPTTVMSDTNSTVAAKFTPVDLDAIWGIDIATLAGGSDALVDHQHVPGGVAP